MKLTVCGGSVSCGSEESDDAEDLHDDLGVE
jgi:hypothetical protein